MRASCRLMPFGRVAPAVTPCGRTSRPQRVKSRLSAVSLRLVYTWSLFLQAFPPLHLRAVLASSSADAAALLRSVLVPERKSLPGAQDTAVRFRSRPLVQRMPATPRTRRLMRTEPSIPQSSAPPPSSSARPPRCPSYPAPVRPHLRRGVILLFLEQCQGANHRRTPLQPFYLAPTIWAVPAQAPEAVCPTLPPVVFVGGREPEVSRPWSRQSPPAPTLPDRLRRHAPLRFAPYGTGRLKGGNPHLRHQQRRRHRPPEPSRL